LFSESLEISPTPVQTFQIHFQAIWQQYLTSKGQCIRGDFSAAGGPAALSIWSNNNYEAFQNWGLDFFFP
jgi:hypothetical protein